MDDAPTRRWKGTCAYDGTDFEGWQSQPGGNTIQDILEARLAKIFKKPLRIQGSARTDSGVHAKAQVFHFDAAWKHPPEALFRALLSELPDGLSLKSLRHAPKTFHALRSATGKRYAYRIFEGQADPFDSRFCWSIGWRSLDVEKMQAAARHLLGRHDFTAFSAVGGSPGDNPVKELRRLDIRRRGRCILFAVEGSGFLYKMVRRLVGALYNVGLGRLEPDQMKTLLANRVREVIIFTSPAKGLCLERVFYR
jgi:tRNA pseudouridine38-40 synthase